MKNIDYTKSNSERRFSALTERQKIIITYCAERNLTDWREIYALGFDGKEAYARNQVGFYKRASELKNSSAAIHLWDDAKFNQRQHEQEIREAVIDEIRNNPEKFGFVPIEKAVKINDNDNATLVEDQHGTKETEQNESFSRLRKNYVDFTNRDEFIDFVAKKINLIQDDKQKLDYMKILADLQQFKSPEKTDKKADIERFYMPLTCENCNLYKIGAENLAKGIKTSDDDENE
jgi:hypothetical protein